MSTSIQLCSRALVMIGANPITALDGTDTSTEATVAIQIYETAVSDLLSRFRWRFAAKQALLSPTTGTDLTRWEATFDLPAEVLVIHALTIEGNRVEFDRYGDQIGASCLTTDAPVLDYGYRVAESVFPSYFDSYVELHLAAIFAYAIANQLDLSDFLEKKAARAFAFAKNQDGQGRTTKKLETNRFLQVRGFSTGPDDGYSGSSGGGSGDLGILLAGVRDGSLPGIDTPIPVANGGTGANTAAGARTGLGLGTIATQAASAVAITGGTISGVTNSASTFTTATISSGTINGTTIGATTASTGAFTTLSSNSITQFSAQHGTNVFGTYSVNTGALVALTSNTSGIGALFGLHSNQNIVASSYTSYDAIRTTPNVATGITSASVRGINISNATVAGTGAVTNQIGINIEALTTGATSNIGIQSVVTSAANGAWNILASGSAKNAFAGNTRFGSAVAPTATVDVTGSIAATTTIKSSGATSGIGYDTGAGGTATQGTSRTTGVTIDKICGRITTFSKTTSASGFDSFTVTNSTVASTDTIIVNIGSGATADKYVVGVTAVAAGSFRIQFYYPAAQGTAEAPIINFAVIKAVSA